MTTAILYSSKTCAPCNQVKGFLNSNNIPYEERDIEQAIQAGFRSVPVLQMLGLTTFGYKPEELEQLKKLYEETLYAN